MEPVTFDVIGGMCTLLFRPRVSTGRDKNTNPGIGFDFRSPVQAFATRDGSYRHGSGVISRTDAARLRDMLDAFLAEHPATEGAISKHIGAKQQ